MAGQWRIGAREITLLLFGAYLLLLLLSHGIHEFYGGVTADEKIQYYRTIGQITQAIGFLRGKDTSMIPTDYYGVINKIIPAVIASAFQLPIRGYYYLTHVVSVSCAIGTAGLLWWASSVTNLRNRWIAPLMLMGSPVFIGYSLMNIKDLPLAFFYTLFTCSLLWLVNHSSPYTFKTLSICTLIVSVISGAFISLRLTLFPVTAASYCATIYMALPPTGSGNDNFRRNIFCLKSKLIRIAGFTAGFSVLSCLVALLALPASWSAPLDYLADAMNTFRNYAEWRGCMNYMGECTGRWKTEGWTSLNYLWQWGISQSTFLNILTYCVGGLLALRALPSVWSGSRLGKENAAILLFALQAYMVILLIVITNANIYSGMRHMLFIYPAAAFLGGIMFNKLSEMKCSISLPFGKLHASILCQGVILLSLILVFIDTLALMPYQYTYFNEARRSLLAAGNTDTDHWQMSLGELYALTSRRSPLFPDAEDGPLHDTRESLAITAPSSDDTRKSRLRAGIATHPGKQQDTDCQNISDVRRRYPITGETIIFHSVVECDN